MPRLFRGCPKQLLQKTPDILHFHEIESISNLHDFAIRSSQPCSLCLGCRLAGERPSPSLGVLIASAPILPWPRPFGGISLLEPNCLGALGSRDPAVDAMQARDLCRTNTTLLADTLSSSSRATAGDVTSAAIAGAGASTKAGLAIPSDLFCLPRQCSRPPWL